MGNFGECLAPGRGIATSPPTPDSALRATSGYGGQPSLLRTYGWPRAISQF